MLLAASPFFVGAGWSLASGLGRLADVAWVSALLLIACRLAGWIAGALVSLLPLRLPARTIGNGIALYVALLVIFHQTRVHAPGSAQLAGTVLLAGYVAGSGCWLLFNGRRRRPAVAHAALGALSVFLLFGWLFGGAADAAVFEREAAGPQAAGSAVGRPDPTAFGPYRVRTLTYGSGLDPYRPEFAADAAIRTRTADATALVADWGWSRRWLWDTDPSAVPLNGRVWLPEGDGEDGPYPVVLIMHGNHGMADYSDEGYGYLGELLASRGYLTVSVDANFLNHSTWEGNLGDAGANVALRAWLFLQHVLEIEALSGTEGHLLSGKADLARIALIGHSRGGQAAVLAAGFDEFFAGGRHAAIRFGRDFGIDAVVALAPTDFLVDNRPVPARNVHYLLLHGSHDADVTAFAGDRQFGRLSFDPEPDRFYMKASLYIGGANHGQFNEDWGRRDIPYPAAWLLDGGNLLSGEEQRQVAKGYVSAFLDTVLKGRDRHLPLFRDHRLGAAWLPDTWYISRYADSRFVPLADFDEDPVRETGRHGTALAAEGGGSWRERDLANRDGSSRGNRVAELAWDGEEAALILDLPDAPIWPEDGRAVDAIGLALADLSGGDGELDVAVELETKDGAVLRAELDDDPPVPAPVETCFLKPFPGGLLEEAVKESGLAASRETVLQSYYVPLRDGRFAAADPAAAEDGGLPGAGEPQGGADAADEPAGAAGNSAAGPAAIEPADVAEIRILLEQEGGGTVLLDDIGLYLTDS